MKMTHAIVVLALATGILAAQTPALKPVEPEYNFAVFALDAGGALVPVERQQGGVQTKVKAMGFGGGSASTVFSGDKSPVRFKAGQKLRFVFRVSDPSIDPATLINLQQLGSSKGKRELVTVKVGAMGMHANASAGKAGSTLQFEKYGEHSYRFSPPADLQPGEYLITAAGSLQSFLFGVD